MDGQKRIFLSKRDWMMDKIHEYYHKGKTVDFIESIFHKEFDKLWKRIQKIKLFMIFQLNLNI